MPGRDGQCFEDFTVGDIYRHPLGGTVLPTDNSWFTRLTQNTAPRHGPVTRPVVEEQS